VIAASAGNHAQGVAYHAKGGSASARQSWMPRHTPSVKSSDPRFGAEVVLEGENYV